MEPRKLESAALFLTFFGALLIMPPLALVFQLRQSVLGLPAGVVYLFVVWALLILCAGWLSGRLPRESDDNQSRKADD